MAATPGYRHEALVYGGAADLQDKIVRFLRAGAWGGESMLVAVREPQLSRLRDALSGERQLIEFVDMGDLGANPAAIITRWLRFLESSAGRPARGVGEPIWSSRSPEELAECQLHEALLNLAVPDGTRFRLLCPYDEKALSPAVLRECRAAHPWVRDDPDGRARSSSSYTDGDHVRDLLRRPLPEPPPTVPAMILTPADRHQVYDRVRRSLDDLRVDAGPGRVLAAVLTDIVDDALLSDARPVTVRVWRRGDRLVGDVAGRRPLDDPLLGRRPGAATGPGRGLWLANHVCALTQIRGDERGSVVRIHLDA